MTPTIQTTFLALSRKGVVLQSFDSAEGACSFALSRKALGVTVELVEETRIRKPIGRSEPVRLKVAGGRG